jgi:exosortase
MRLEKSMTRLAAAAPWGAVVLVVAAAYAQVLQDLVHDWIRDPNYSHGFLIPVVSMYLIWKQRQRLRSSTRSASNLGFIGILLAACCLIVGAAAAEVFTQRVSFVVLLVSIVVYILGWRWARAVAFPLGFLLFAIPLPYVIYYSVTGPMQGLAARCAVLGLRVVGVPALAQGNIIHLPQTSLEVAEACSGIRSLSAFLALGALLAHSMRIPVWGRCLVFLLTIPLSVAANAVRVWGSGLGAYLIGPRAAEGLVHELFGLVVFATALGLFVLLGKGAQRLWRSAA